MRRGLLVVLICAASVPARADEAPPPAAVATPPGAAEEAPSPKRTLPDYDGRPEPGATPGEVLVWAPRIALFPAWLVAEFVIRRPLGLLVVTAERGNWPSEIISFFTFGNSNVGIVPTFFVDFGFRPFFGLYFFYDSDGAYSLRVRGSATLDGYSAAVANRWKTDAAGSRLQVQADVLRKPDRAFYGIGPRTLDSDLARYGLFRAGGSARYDWYITRGVHLAGEFDLHTNDFKEPRCCDQNEVRVADLPVLPPGFPDGFTTLAEHVEAIFDSRPPRPEPQTGARLRLAFEHVNDIRGDNSWIRATGTLGGFLDMGRARIVGLTVTAALADAISGEIPFPELISFGGTGLAMPGLRTDRLYGKSALSASLRYEWPIWVLLAGTLQVECGNVFGHNFDGIDADDLRLSVVFGFRTTNSPDHAFQVLLGVGTETFGQGAALTSFRLAIGGTYGF